jgi:hypothetical protein
VSQRYPASALIPVIAQTILGVGALASLALAPPSRGPMLLLPLVHDAPVVRLARQGDALLLGRGPGEAIVVEGERGALFWPLLHAGVLTMAAPAALCGGR